MSVAGVAALLVAADSFLGGGTASGPAAAQAAPAAAVSSVAAAEPMRSVDLTVRDDVLVAGASVRSLAQRLEAAQARLPRQTPDAFETPPQWRSHDEVPQAIVPARDGFDPKAFAQTYRVDAVFVSDGVAQAVANGTVVQEGDVCEGMTLQRIGDRWLEWAGHGVRVRVHVDSQ